MRTLLAIAALALAPVSAHAATFIVEPTLAPNAFGSPSYDDWVNNSIYAQLNGLPAYGTPNQPTYYQAQANVTPEEGIVTGFPSWMGQADPGNMFGSQFANELGNRMLFGVKIDGAGQQFAINDLAFSASSSDPLNALGFSFGAGSYNYSNDYRGVLKGADGVLFTADDTYVTSGPNTQLVDGLVGRGSGNSFAAYCTGCSTSLQQQTINDTAAYWKTLGGGTFTGTYALGADTGSGTFNISSAVPEPATWAMMIVGFGLVGGTLRVKKNRKTPALA